MTQTDKQKVTDLVAFKLAESSRIATLNLIDLKPQGEC